MALLRKLKKLAMPVGRQDYRVKASTLMETLVATVLIVTIFMIASMILNNLFTNTIRNNTRDIENSLRQLEYLYIHKKIRPPYHDDYKTWEINVTKLQQRGSKIR